MIFLEDLLQEGKMFVQSIVLLETSRGEFYLRSLLKFIVEAVLLIMASVIKSNNIIMKLLWLMVNMRPKVNGRNFQFLD